MAVEISFEPSASSEVDRESDEALVTHKEPKQPQVVDEQPWAA